MKTTYLINFFKYLIPAILTFLIPIKGFLILISLAVGFDTLFAVYTTVKLYGWKSYQSTKLFNIVIKTFFYMFTIIFSYVIDYYLIGVGGIFGIPLLIAKLTTGFWIYIECKSWDETNQKLGNPPFLTTLKKLMNKLKELKKDLNEIKSDD
jgi:hypothetical protein